MQSIRAQRFTNLDDLRGYAALIVVLLHGLDGMGYNHVLPSAYLAVDFFFALSGFVIAHSYDDKLRSGMSTLDFMRRRMARLYPLLFAGITLGLLTAVAKAFATHQTQVLPAIAKSYLVGLTLFPVPWLTEVEHGAAWPLNVPTWSLFAEIVINLVFAAMIVKRSDRTTAVIAAGGFLLTVYVYLVAHMGDDGSRWGSVFVGLARTIYPFLIGVLLRRHALALARFAPAVGPSAVGFALAAILIQPFDGPLLSWFNLALIALVFPWLIVTSASSPQRQTSPRFLDLGHLSYAIYVLHYPLVKMFSFAARRTSLSPAIIVSVLALELSVAIALGWLADRYFDKPVQAYLARRRGATRRATSPATPTFADVTETR